MDSSALIFVALAVAWAVYLVPKALEHHEESARSRTVDRFSHTMRVLARREPVSRRRAQLVSRRTERAAKVAAAAKVAEKTTPARPVSADVRARRLAAAKAARRRLRVVSVILVANATVAILAGLEIVAWPWTLVPVGVLVVWLVACRLMVRKEQADAPARRVPTTKAEDAPQRSDQRSDQRGDQRSDQREEQPEDSTEEIAVVSAEASTGATAVDPDSWDPMPVTLPTYVDKPVATRSVRTIDLDSTGVWTSGRSDSDSALVREADEAARASSAEKQDSTRRAVGS